LTQIKFPTLESVGYCSYDGYAAGADAFRCLLCRIGSATIYDVPKPLKQIPTFASEDEEREFWSHADSTEYIDWSKAKERSLSRLKPTLRTISISLPLQKENVVDPIAEEARRQSLLVQTLRSEKEALDFTAAAADVWDWK
jgi:hypothetical protein